MPAPDDAGADADDAAAAADDPLRRFVVEMNRAASSLGMNGTTFRNPHGLTENGHLSTAVDLIRLAHRALRMSSFRKCIVSHRVQPVSVRT